VNAKQTKLLILAAFALIVAAGVVIAMRHSPAPQSAPARPPAPAQAPAPAPAPKPVVVRTVEPPVADPILAKARAYLGDEAALDSLISIRMTGKMETGRYTAGGRVPVKRDIEIIYQKPCQQRIVATDTDMIELTALDDYTGWQRVQSLAKEKRWRMNLLTRDQVKRLRAYTWENLNFYRGIERRGGRVEVVGPAKVGTADAVKVAFIYEPSIVYYRYFDPATGRLILTETTEGGRITQEGEIRVGGIRFPSVITQVAKAKDASGAVVDNPIVITLDRITINERYPDSYFEVPTVRPR